MRKVRAFAPGRIELAGNHTDHQGGRVIAAAVDRGVEVVVQPNATNCARVESDGFAPVELDIGDMQAHDDERATSAALVRGIVAGMCASGMEVGGFDAHVTSSVPAGSGLSSSAAFELALAAALSRAFNDGEKASDMPLVKLAKVGQSAERDYFGKPCGLMDQLAVALGGIIAVDFSQDEPVVERIEHDFSACGHALCIIDTHCDHGRYTDEYAQVALDMFSVARRFGKRRLAEVPEEALLGELAGVRRELGDLPALRALHYYHENRLVDARARALREADMGAFLELTRRSGASSAAYLQNVSSFDRRLQPAMVALALADTLLEGQGACRIHGGGFGGTIQAFVPIGRLEAFTRGMDFQLGHGSCRVYEIGGEGARASWE